MNLHKYKTRSVFATIPLTLGYRVNIEKLEIVFETLFIQKLPPVGVTFELRVNDCSFIQ